MNLRQNDDESLLNTIRQSWGWCGLEPATIFAVNSFGNILVQAVDGRFWRICPEHLCCDVVAQGLDEIEKLWARDDFQFDWQMARMVALAQAKLGPLDDQWCYCLKIPATLGGHYDSANLGLISRRELVAFAGEVSKQIKNLPDGTKFKFVFMK